MSDHVYKFMSLKTGITPDALKNDQLRLSFPSSFNDPFDGTVFFTGLTSADKAGIAEHLDVVRRQNQGHPLAQKLAVMGGDSTQTNTHLVTCFTTSPDEPARDGFKYSDLMWAHYADQHQGICVKYRRSDAPLSHAVPLYRQDAQTHAPVSPYGDIPADNVFRGPVQYTSDPITVPVSQGRILVDISSNIFFQKLNSWRFEQEYRVVLRAPVGFGFSTRQYFHIKARDIGLEMEEIILGLLISDKDRRAFIDCFQDTPVKLAYAHLDISKTYITWGP